MSMLFDTSEAVIVDRSAMAEIPVLPEKHEGDPAALLRPNPPYPGDEAD